MVQLTHNVNTHVTLWWCPSRWLVNNKADGIRTATQVAGEGLRFAGQLSAAVLRVLLQVSVLEVPSWD